jgi:hypothetical protein
MSGADSRHGRNKKIHIKFQSGDQNGRDHLINVGLYGNIILQRLFKK